MKFIIALVAILIGSINASSQTDSTRNDNDELTYFYVDWGCPTAFKNHPEKEYGFLIKCAGCEMTDEIERNNKKVISKIDMVKGKGWTEMYIRSLVQERRVIEDDKQKRPKE